MQRYFIGLTLSNHISDRIITTQNELGLAQQYNRQIMQPLVPHITLLHPGMVQAISPVQLIPKVNRLAKQWLPITIELLNFELFDDRLLYISVHSEKLIVFYNQLTALLLKDVQVQDNERPFKPHVTLLQSKPQQNLPPELINSCKNQLASELPYRFEAKRISLFTWLRPRIYKVEQI